MQNPSDRDPRTYSIIGAAMEVHKEVGPGFLEAVYQEALAIELTDRKIPFLREAAVAVHYKGRPLGTPYRADFICHGGIVVELKAQTALGLVDQAQVIHYLKGTKLEVGLLINFGAASLEFQRFAHSHPPKQSQSA
jgi:GxxExxY protein